MEKLCIFCKKNSKYGRRFELSKEHIIPQSIGGWITIRFVCKTCNNNLFGSEVESKLKQNVFIVTAIDKLNIHTPDKAYKSAEVVLEFSDEIKAIGKINNNGEVEFIPTRLNDGSIIAPEEKSKEILAKQIKRYEKANNVKVEFEIEKFGKFPYNILIPIYSTDICFIKRKEQNSITIISNLSEPIPFLLPAKILFEHLSGISYDFIMNKVFDPFRSWILGKDMHNKVLLNTPISQVNNPKDLDYLAYHFIRYSFFNNDLVALIGLFGIIRFSVFLGSFEDISIFPDHNLLDVYHVYDLNKKNLFLSIPSQEIIDDDTTYMRGVQFLAKSHLSN